MTNRRFADRPATALAAAVLLGGSPAARAACSSDLFEIRCERQRTTLLRGVAGASPRAVHFALPEGEAPGAGWPVVLFFHGEDGNARSLFGAERRRGESGYFQAEAVGLLIESGYAVVAPEAPAGGWHTKRALYGTRWERTADHQLVLDLLWAIADGELGPLDAERMFAIGFSAGGAMASRLGLSYPGFFRALAIHSGSYATCFQLSCAVPEQLAPEHPPTVFLHGSLDLTVPVWTMAPYEESLRRAGVATRRIERRFAGHAFLRDTGAEILAWFELHQ